jgi:hypothetical protein
MGTVVTLDGAASVDPDGPDGRPATYEWVVLARPEGSLASPRESLPREDAIDGPRDDTRTPSAVFFVDMVGQYTLELRVTDGQGLSNDACNAADNRLVYIDSRPMPALEVVLENGPNGADELAAPPGVDLDLHLRHPEGDWFTVPFDCSSDNSNPDWGMLGNPDDDPVLFSDAPGALERLLYPRPENSEVIGRPYTVGVHGFDAPPGLAAPFTVTIRINGEIAYTSPPGLAIAKDDFCTIATLDWPSGTVTPAIECGPRPR